jgi:hypothetical protein
VIELSRDAFEVLRSDKDFVLYRGRCEDDQSQAAFASYGAPNVGTESRRSAVDEGRSRVLVLSPLTEYVAPEILRWLENAYSLREKLDRRWAARPVAIARQWDRTVLVLEDPG